MINFKASNSFACCDAKDIRQHAWLHDYNAMPVHLTRAWGRILPDSSRTVSFIATFSLVCYFIATLVWMLAARLSMQRALQPVPLHTKIRTRLKTRTDSIINSAHVVGRFKRGTLRLLTMQFRLIPTEFFTQLDDIADDDQGRCLQASAGSEFGQGG